MTIKRKSCNNGRWGSSYKNRQKSVLFPFGTSGTDELSDAYDFITFQTGTRKLERFKKEYQKEGGGRYDMCKAIDDMERHAEERERKLTRCAISNKVC